MSQLYTSGSGGGGVGAFYPVLNKDTTNDLYYFTAISGRSTSTTSVNTNVLYLVPFSTPVDLNVNTVACEVVTAAAGAVGRLGIYSTTNGIPTNVFVDCGIFDSSTTGIKDCAISTTLTAGVDYFLAVTVDLNGGSVSLRSTANFPLIRTISTSFTSSAISYFETGIDPSVALPDGITPAVFTSTSLISIGLKIS